VAVILELAQIFVPHRFPSLLDVAASAGGAFAGAGLARLFLLLWRRYLDRASA
jgi:VanZ family protein